ncbi:hypothetical protein TIFTF001_056000, partial [Ficus carica]
VAIAGLIPDRVIQARESSLHLQPSSSSSWPSASCGPQLQPIPREAANPRSPARARESSRKSSPRDFWAVLLRPAIPALYQLII